MLLVISYAFSSFLYSFYFALNVEESEFERTLRKNPRNHNDCFKAVKCDKAAVHTRANNKDYLPGLSPSDSVVLW